MPPMDVSLLGIKRQLKRAKLFEIQKLIRQIRVLENKKGSDAQLQKSKRKVERLLEILDALKDLDLSSLAEEFCQSLQEGSGLPSSRDPGEQASSGSYSERAKHRLLTNKAFQRNINRLSAESTKLEPFDVSRGDTSQEGVPTKTASISIEVGHASGRKEPAPGGMVPSLKRETSGGSESSDTETETEFEEGVSSGNDTSEDSLDVSEGEVDGSSQTLQTGRKGARKRGRDESQLSTVGREVGRLSTRKKLQLESAFVETLSATSHSPANQKAAKRLKGNRPGQRTRQKKWERMFGKNAKHVAEGKKQQKTKTTKGKEKGKERLARRSRVSRQSLPVSRRKAKKPSSNTEPQLHPSWEAHRRKKAMETGILQFQGQKTVFSD